MSKRGRGSIGEPEGEEKSKIMFIKRKGGGGQEWAKYLDDVQACEALGKS